MIIRTAYYMIIGLIVSLVSMIFFDEFTSITIGFFTTLLLLAILIMRVWVREIFKLFTGEVNVSTIIRKGFHRPFPYFNINPFIFWNDNHFTLHKYVKFTNDSLYPNPDGRYTINKLFGFSLGHPHKHSYRWGWRVNTFGKLYVMPYSYINGERVVGKETEIKLHESVHLYICYSNNHVQYFINRESITYHEINVRRFNIAWKLGNYFGGKLPAPKTIKLFVI